MNVNQRQKRIALVVAHLGPGGAQRVVTTAANALVARGIDVHVVTISMSLLTPMNLIRGFADTEPLRL